MTHEPAARPQPVLDVRDLRVSYATSVLRRRTASRPAVDGVSLDVGEREIVGLVGESGSGKSTVAQAVLGLVPVAAGVVTINGKSLNAMTGRELRKARADAQMVFQDPYSSLDPKRRIRSGLRELRATHPDRSAWVDDAALLSSVGLDASLLDRFPHQLSGGQIQRVVVARALLLRPRLLIVDEPTSSLDVSVQAQILTLFSALRDEHGVAILFISHDLSVVHHITSRVYVMQRGAVVEEGPTTQVLNSPSHDYTRRLVASIPGRGRLVGRPSGHQVDVPKDLEVAP